MSADGVQVLEDLISDKDWERIVSLLPLRRRKNGKGRPRMSDRQAMTAILYRLRTGCAWKALPRELGAASTVYDHFQEWRAIGIFEKMSQIGVLGQDEIEML